MTVDQARTGIHVRERSDNELLAMLPDTQGNYVWPPNEPDGVFKAEGEEPILSDAEILKAEEEEEYNGEDYN